jgi:signal transduction histidine kinase
MKIITWDWIRQLRRLLATDSPEPSEQAARVVAMQRGVVLPSKAGVILVVLYYLFYSGWFYEAPTTRSVVQDFLKHFFLVYALCNAAGWVLFALWQRFPREMFRWLAFTLGLLDGLFMAGMVMVTGGFDSIVFWIFPGLILLNAFSIQRAMPQIVLNLLLSLFYLAACLGSPHLTNEETALINVPGHSANSSKSDKISTPVFTATNFAPAENPAHLRKASWNNDFSGEVPAESIPTEAFLLRVAVLWLLTLCCYGAQVLLERQRLALAEAGEFAARESQLHSAGRLAAEFAHQIKNPLAVINNAAYSLRRSLKNNSAVSAEQQIEIIQEEVARADRVITQVMGYAQLSEGRLERLDVAEKINKAVEQVFPAAVPGEIRVEKKISGPLPPLLMQRAHLSEILVNLLLNAREALGEKGNVVVEAFARRDQTVEISVADDGPGIAPDKLERIFEAYFTTKEKGTGLGLAIVRRSAELYGGSVRVESALGKGAKFTVSFPAKTLPNPILP